MLSAKRKTGLVFFPAFDWSVSPTHPEREERLLYTQDQVMEEGLLDLDGVVEYRVRPATYADIRRTHFCVPDEAAVTTESHLIAAGGCLVAADAVMKREVDSAFALVRPPGHHAMRVVHGNRGFCNINIEAVMIEYIRDVYNVRKVAIVDTDCHHGDGTQDIYWHDPDTLFISIHQDGRTLYPGTGFPADMGGPNAIGSTINIPLPPRTGEEGFRTALDELVMPLIERFEPELIVNSAGQDNHYEDPITHMNFSARGYADLTARLKPHLAVLEGGYSVEKALPYINVGIIMAMAGLPTATVKEPNYDTEYEAQTPEVDKYVDQTISTVRKQFITSQPPPDINKDGRIIERRRNIFYDTDMIQELQTERIRRCRDCAGALWIESSSSRGYRILAIHVPRWACPACQKQARQWCESVPAKTYDKVYIQDRTKNSYTVI
ncbi:MAG: histone deacetylase [Deltaproteobacteria bacterium]|nr:histone deacetylase [Deltaproteobacteria bacterium]